MFKNLFLVCCAVLAVSGLPYYAQDISGFISQDVGLETADDKQISAAVAKAPQQALAHYATGVRSAFIPQNKMGHFSADFQINGRYVLGMIDTGATYVAINTSTARRLGLGLTNADFKHQVQTANGLARSALVVLDRMNVGSISVSNVEAFVLDDKALTATLIGMSFMSRLQSYRVKNNNLELIN
ncbi:TIGR02281 family clan AA aspartic protease [Hoeflea sp. YIM 152468]|uniref:retropepsin-like aspartic protease family protein n=1 Tax=Hoeflea sp. YIM 152468 TaxID=3031759 RepID=UPI0023DAD018|nr:TIGR02281 family clan AA aspartic protease [Hoeflea sp. YIM 152468]MDF1610371.1 TIGR02281 family clan AA aspartic protease [Hoeflea sp. YIM 152468]